MNSRKYVGLEEVQQIEQLLEVILERGSGQ